MVHDSANSSPDDSSNTRPASTIWERHSHVSTQLQEWMAARSRVSSKQVQVQEPAPPPPGPLGIQPTRRERQPNISTYSASTPSGVIDFAFDATESLSCVHPIQH